MTSSAPEKEILSVLNMTELPEQKFVYQLLDRCLQDCKYYTEQCANPAYLWGKSVEYHLYAMRVFYNYLVEKPEWFPISMLEQDELMMLYKVGNKFIDKDLNISGTITEIKLCDSYDDNNVKHTCAYLKIALDTNEEKFVSVKPKVFN